MEQVPHTRPSADSLRERARQWLEPISSEAPCGAAARQHPTYEAVFAEVARLESPTGEAVRWDEVVRGAGELLRDTTKDLWLGAYFAYGLYATEGLPGALTGVTLLAELTERYWEGLFPETSRLRSRARALSWYVERMARVLPTPRPGGTPPELVEALAASVSRLAEVTRTRLAAQGPALEPLLGSVERLRASLCNAPAEPLAPAAAPEPPSPAVEPPAAAGPPPAPMDSRPPSTPMQGLTRADAATDFLRNMGASLASAAGVLRQARSADPLAYRLLRTGLWLHLAQPPPTDAQGRTALPPLPAPLRAKLEALTAHARWAELLDEAESALTQHRFVLDLQRFSAQALASLGPSHACAREALVLELAALLERMPTLVELVTSDGTPLADAATRQWLRREVPARPGPTPRPSALPPGAGELEPPSQGRARFVSRLRLARACAQAGQPSAARALYELLDADCSAHALDAWEPALAAACLEGYLNFVIAGTESTTPLAGEFWPRYRRLAQLDPAAALRVQP